MAQMTDDLETFFKRKSIFITGATGFVGKILVEKILCSFPDIDAIYLLIRNKGDKNAACRLQKMIDCEMWKLGTDALSDGSDENSENYINVGALDPCKENEGTSDIGYLTAPAS